MMTADGSVSEGEYLRARIAMLERALLSVYSLAVSEQKHPTELHMTCLSLIQKQAESVLDLSKYDQS